jgi:hypothetical protein
MFWKRESTDPRKPLDLERIKRAIVRVGRGRGFLVGDHRKNGDGYIWRDVVTAVSCLPEFPSFIPFKGPERLHSYDLILGRLDEEPSLSAECRFADPVSNLAVLGSHSDAYNQFIHWDIAIQIAEPLRPYAPGWGPIEQDVWLLMLNGEWIKCTATGHTNHISISGEPGLFDGALSGTPIINADGNAIGMISAPRSDEEDYDGEWYYCFPILARRLPDGALGPNAGVI